ncbi:MAG TPA: beta-ketoacyl synthase N-terminal-like domain-containing protein [Polyangia bacterium]|nr:beta-ketoacyl synthase N-terminal-like domain-containing protein [Polyangia bacterium]
MARERRSEVVVTGAHALTVAPGGAITPARWAGKEARLARMDRLCALALVACDGALVDGALTPAAPEWDGERTAIVFGSAYGCHATNEDYYRGLVRDGQLGASPRLFAYTLPSSPVGEISIHYGVRGPATAWCNGLTSGLDAFAEGVALIERGRADRVLVCAAEVATPLLTRIVAGEGPSLYGDAALVDAGAALLLERAGDAARRGATPRGRLLAADAAFHAGSRTTAVGEAIARTLAAADLAAGAFAAVLAAPVDVATTRRAGVHARQTAGDDTTAAVTSVDAVDAPTTKSDGNALGAAPLIAVAEFFGRAAQGTLALACAGDDGGAATAAALLSG